MRIYIVLGCLVASSLAQETQAANASDNKLGPVSCALDQLELPDDTDIDLSFLIEPLETVADELKDTLDGIYKITEPDNPTLKTALSSIISTLNNIISSIESALSEVEENPKSLESVFGLLRSILHDVINLFNSLEEIILTGLALVGSGSSDVSGFIIEVSKLVGEAIRTILSNLADSTSSIPVLGKIFEAFNNLLLPIVERVISIIDEALGVSIPINLGLGSLTSEIVGVLDHLLGRAIEPLVRSILPSGSSACASSGENPRQPGIDIRGPNLGSLFGGNDDDALGAAASPNPVVSLPSKVINMLGSLVSSPTSMSIDDLLSSISAAGVTPPIPGASDPETKTQVIRPSPDTICIPLEGAKPTTMKTLNSSLGMSLVNLGVQLSAGMPNQKADLGNILDSLEPIQRLLRAQIEILDNVPVGELGSGSLVPVLQILENLSAMLSGEGPIDAQEVASRLFRALVLFIAFTAISSEGDPAVSQILGTLLVSLGQPILRLLGEMGLPENQLQALGTTVTAVGNSVEKRFQSSGSQFSNDSGGSSGGLLGVVNSLLKAVIG